MPKHRPHTNSTSERKRIAAKANDKISAPDVVHKDAKKIFKRIIDLRAKADWIYEHDIELAGYMANIMLELKREILLLNSAIPEDRTLHIKNINTFTSTLMQYRRTLNLHQARDGSARRTQQRLAQNKETETKIKLTAIEGGLLA